MSDAVISEKIYRLLLHLYPHRFRSEYGAEMLQLFRDRLATETSHLRLWLDVLADLAISVPREHRRPSHDFRVSPIFESFKAMLKVFLGLAIMSELALRGGASPEWITALWFFSIDVGFIVLLHGWRAPALEYTVEGDGVGFRSQRSIIYVSRAEIARITESRDMLVVFSTSGAHIPIPTGVSNYSTLRAQLAAWVPIEVPPSSRLPGGIVALGFLATLLMRNPWAVVLAGFAVAAAILYSTFHPDSHPQISSTTTWKRFIPPFVAVAFIGTKIAMTLSSL